MNHVTLRQRLLAYRHNPPSFFLFLLVCLAALLTMLTLIFLVLHILVNGLPYLSRDLFSWHYTAENLSVMPALINTLLMTFLSLLLAVPAGIGAAIYLVEYARRGNRLVSLIRVTAETLSGVPSIVYGLFGLLFFVSYLGWGYSLLAGAFTLTIMILPLIMRTTEEALLAVPLSYREGSYALGAGRLRTIFRIVLPAAAPGILSGILLSVGRIVGESAALLYTASTLTEVPRSLFDSARTLAVHMYVLSSEGLHLGKTYATAVVLLAFAALLNALSAYAAKKISR